MFTIKYIDYFKSQFPYLFSIISIIPRVCTKAKEEMKPNQIVYLVLS